MVCGATPKQWLWPSRQMDLAAHLLLPQNVRQRQQEAAGNVAGDDHREVIEKAGRGLETLRQVTLHNKVAVDVRVELAQVLARLLRTGHSQVVLCQEEAGVWGVRCEPDLKGGRRRR